MKTTNEIAKLLKDEMINISTTHVFHALDPVITIKYEPNNEPTVFTLIYEGRDNIKQSFEVTRGEIAELHKKISTILKITQ